MSYALYGFGEIPNFRLNEPGQVSPIGEMTKENYTYSNEVERYSLAKYPNAQLISLSSERDDVKVAVGLVYTDLVLKMTEWLYTRSISSNIPADKPTLLQALRAEFGDIADIKEVGDIIYKDSYLFPSYITLSATNAGEDNDLYIWYSHKSLEELYPNVEYTGILPVPNEDIDQLADDRDIALSLLRQITIVNHNSRVNAAAEGHPQTYLVTMNFTWHDKDNPDITHESPFSVLCYGPQSKNIDLIKDYLRKLILSLSKHGEDIWSIIYPELFVPTEFYVIPLWDRIALPNKGDGTGVYESSVRQSNVLQYAKKYCKGYTEDHLKETVGVHAANYQELMFVSCGNIQNYAAKPAFDEQWPAYCAIDTKSPDFARIPQQTQLMIMALSALFKAAEVATEHTIIPQDMTRTVREDVYYLTKSVDNIQFLCPIKKGFKLGN